MDHDYRTPIEKVICEHCEHDFQAHEDCKRCERDHDAWREQVNAKLLPLEFHGIALGDVYSQTIRLVL